MSIHHSYTLISSLMDYMILNLCDVITYTLMYTMYYTLTCML